VNRSGINPEGITQFFHSELSLSVSNVTLSTKETEDDRATLHMLLRSVVVVVLYLFSRWQ
jgi:hypothetical protein